MSDDCALAVWDLLESPLCVKLWYIAGIVKGLWW